MCYYSACKWTVCLRMSGTIKEGSVQDQALPQSDEHGKPMISVTIPNIGGPGTLEGT